MTDIESRIKHLKENSDKPYLIKYAIECGNFGKEDVTNKNDGLTQDLIFISCMTGEDGSYSQTWLGIDGQKKAVLNSAAVFMAWIMMADSIRELPDLPPGVREFVDEVFETHRASVLAMRSQG